MVLKSLHSQKDYNIFQGLHNITFHNLQNTIINCLENVSNSQERRQPTNANHKMTWSLKYEKKILKQLL